MNAPQQKTARPPAPEELAGEALLEWERLCNELDQAGLLSTADRAIMTLHCQTWMVYRQTIEATHKYGAVIKWPNGIPGPGPFWKVASECTKMLRGTIRDLGLTPASRGFKANEKDDDFVF